MPGTSNAHFRHCPKAIELIDYDSDRRIVGHRTSNRAGKTITSQARLQKVGTGKPGFNNRLQA